MKQPEFAVLEFEQLQRGCYSVDFGPDGGTVIGLNVDDTAAIWDAKSGKILQRKELKRSGPAMDNWMSPDRLQFVACVNNQTVIFDAKTLTAKTTLSFDASAVCWSRDGKLMAVADYNGAIHVINTPENRELATLELGKYAYVAYIAFMADTSELLFQTNEATFTYDYRNGTPKKRLSLDTKARPWHCSLSRDGKTFIRVSKNGALIKTDTTTWKSETFKVSGKPTSCSLSPDAQRVAMISGSTVIIWDLVENRPWLKWKKPNYRFVLTGAFSPDGQRFVCTPDYQVHVLDFRSGAKDQPMTRHQPKPGEHQCLYMVGPDEQMDLEGGYGEPLNPLPIKCPFCKMPDMDFVAAPYYLGRKINAPTDMAPAQDANFLVHDSMKRLLDLVAPGQCKFYPTTNLKTKQPTPWLLAVPQHLQVTATPPENRERCPKCNEPWCFHPYSECADKRTWASPFSTHDVFKSKNWASGCEPFKGWNKGRPGIYGRTLHFSVRLETLIKKLHLKGMVRSADCKEVPTAEDLAWVEEKFRLTNQARPKAATSKKPTDATDWFNDYLKAKAKKKPVVHDFAAVEKKHGVKLPESYKKFIAKVGTKTFKDLDDEEGFCAHILPPKKLDFKEYRKPEPAEEEEPEKIDGVMFATTDHGDVFCFDISARNHDYPVYLYKHETDEYEPYAGNFAACIKQFAKA
jgi:WD40 repeat protein